ncbi:hypothetical protein FKM82_004276 [Ascaphus truei]
MISLRHSKTHRLEPRPQTAKISGSRVSVCGRSDPTALIVWCWSCHGHLTARGRNTVNCKVCYICISTYLSHIISHL